MVRDRLSRLRERLFAPVDIASLVVFRFAFGAILVWEAWRYFNYGWIDRYWVYPVLNFKYYGFTWIEAWPAVWMHRHMAALGVLAAFIAVGLFYRVSTVLFALGFSYMFLLEQGRYLNHFYLVTLLSWMMVFIPAHRSASFDAWMRPQWAREFAPAWALWLLRAQIGITYFFGGVAKLHADWLSGAPARVLMEERAGMPTLGPILNYEVSLWVIAYGGLLLDLLVVPLLLWRPTRLVAFVFAILFHLLNATIFTIGIFPWFMMAATLLYFDPGWPRGRIFAPMADAEAERMKYRPASPWVQKTAMAVLAVYMSFQLVFPLRHHLYPGDVNWTEEGHRFSWHMILRRKRATAVFEVTNPDTGETWMVDPDDRLQEWHWRKMSTTPDMALQFARFLAEEKRNEGHARIEVRAHINASLNGRPMQPLIDPTVDLAAQPRNLMPAPWILPLTEPLPDSHVLWRRAVPLKEPVGDQEDEGGQ